MVWPRHEEVSVRIAAEPAAVFAHVDDQSRLGAHMGKPSLMMLGGRMAYEFDEARGQAVGSVIRMTGVWPGFTLSVEEVVTERIPPRFKAWTTLGEPKLLVIGGYRMGFEIAPAPGGSSLRVFIDYAPPRPGGTLLGFLFGRMYARWCVRRMAQDAAHALSGP